MTSSLTVLAPLLFLAARPTVVSGFVRSYSRKLGNSVPPNVGQKSVWAGSARGVASAEAWMQTYFDMVCHGIIEDGTCGTSARYDFCAAGTSDNCTGRLKIDENYRQALHVPLAQGYGRSREYASGKPTVEEVEALYDEQLGDMTRYSPWMDNHFAIYYADINHFVDAFERDGVPYLALTWRALDGRPYYSVIVHPQHTQVVYEIISSARPMRATRVEPWPVARHFFEEAGLMDASEDLVPLHISRTARNLSEVISFYNDIFAVQPFQHSEFEGGQYVVFNHGGLHVQYWQRDGQTGPHTTAWLEEQLEAVTRELLVPKGCWPVWGDNHYTIPQPWTTEDYTLLIDKLDARGVGYRAFANMPWDQLGALGTPFEEELSTLKTIYVPLPGGMYVEMQPQDSRAVVVSNATAMWDPKYCYQDCVGVQRDAEVCALPLT